MKFNKKKEFVQYFDISSSIPPNTNNKLGIVSIVQNQAKHIEDWIKFHYIAGVKVFYFYIDNCKDDTEKIINNMSKLKDIKITIIPWTIISKFPDNNKYLDHQILSYTHALLNFGHKNEWMLFIDTDEYLVPIGKKTIIEAIDHLRNYSNISFQWTMFGSNGHITKPLVGDIFAYTKKVDNNLPELHNYTFTKCLVKPSQVNSVSIHRFFTNDMGRDTVNDTGYISSNKTKYISRNTFSCNTYLQLNHYYIRSEEEFNTKINWYKKWCDSNHHTNLLYGARDFINGNATDDTSIYDFLVLHNINNYEEFKNY